MSNHDIESNYDIDTSLSLTIADEMLKTLSRCIDYQITDKRAKSNFLRSAAREPIELEEKQRCSIIHVSAGVFLRVIIPLFNDWKIHVKDRQDLSVVESTKGFDENGKHVETLSRFMYCWNKITVTCYNSTQRIKVMIHLLARFCFLL